MSALERFSHVVVALDKTATRDELNSMADKMRADGALSKPITISVGGYDEDKRELWAIPEVRLLCRRIVASRMFPMLVRGPETDTGGLSAYYVWLIAQGLMRSRTRVTPEQQRRFAAEYDGRRAS